ncbi:MAG: UDP-N-acetylmuramoyl-tripeptide--D-alanyl-D-alanine ligase [Planctomycetota bacterium]
MISISIPEILGAINGKVISEQKDLSSRRVNHISTDTRAAVKGSAFFALKGPNFDGHNFINDAVTRGATVLVVSRRVKTISGRAVVIKVADTLKALGELAGYYRGILSIPIIAVTGSNGKTTTKEMLACILSGQGPTARSPKSFNNYIGVPLAIFSIEPRHRYAVLEVGTNRPGEIAYLGRIARPNVAVITNVAPTHLEELKSLEGIAREKASLFEYLASNGTAVYGADSNLIKKFIPKAENRVETFSLKRGGTLRASGIKNTAGCVYFIVSVNGSNTKYACHLPVIGDWNVNNALAAITAARAVGVPVKDSCRALALFKAPPMRMERRTLKGVTYINDAYNANPSAVTCALQALAREKAGRRIFVFGEMRELGSYTRKYHQAVAGDIARAKIDGLVCVGRATRSTLQALPKNKPEYSRLPVKLSARGGCASGAQPPILGSHSSAKGAIKLPMYKFYCNNVSQAINCLNQIVQKGDTVLLKGSRASGLERILSEL